MKTIAGSALVLCATGIPAAALAQTPVGALAVDERQGDQYGWAVDYETAGAAQSAALGECGAGCSVVLTFERCAAYAADQDADSTAVGWAESYSSAAAAQQAALGECSLRGGGSGCIARVWGCNSPALEDGLGLDRAARREIQEGLQAAGFDPRRRGRDVRPAHASCDSTLAVVSWRSCDGVSGWCVGGVAAAIGLGPADVPAARTGRCRHGVGAHVAAACRYGAAAIVAGGERGARESVLAVDREQHGPCGLRGIS